MALPNVLAIYDRTPDQVMMGCMSAELNFDGTKNEGRWIAIEILDGICANRTGFAKFVDLLNAAGNYRPTIRYGKYAPRGQGRVGNAEMKLLADCYDYFMKARGDSRRAFRG
jgi:hypothetical protein